MSDNDGSPATDLLLDQFMQERFPDGMPGDPEVLMVALGDEMGQWLARHPDQDLVEQHHQEALLMVEREMMEAVARGKLESVQFEREDGSTRIYRREQND